MENQQPQREQKLKRKSRRWLWVLGGFILLIIVIVYIGSGNETNSNQTQTTANKNINIEVVKTITIPSLVEYDDDKTEDDAVADIEQEDVAIPSNYTVVSSDNTNITNPVGSEAIISSVVDGDTVKLSDGNKVRILGIDTPETVDPRKAVQCFGKEASDKMKELVDGKKIILLVDASQGDKDKYGRLLRYIYLDNVDIGATMIREGYAYAYLKYPTSKTEEYKVLEAQAREGKKGLWAETTCNGLTEIPKTTPQTNTVTNTNTSTNLNVAPIPTNTSVNTNQTSNANTNTVNIEPEPEPTPIPSASFNCDCSKTCTQMVSCDEAYYQLNTCGCSKRDGDDDGVPCESICSGG